MTQTSSCRTSALACALAFLLAAHSGYALAEPSTVIAAPALYPETIVADAKRDQLLVGSVHKGAVYELGRDGATKKLIDDARLISVLGIALDAARNRVFVTSSDLGISVKHSTQGPKKHAGVGIYERVSGRALHFVDLSAVAPAGDHLINGITLDPQGNAYVTDSLSPVIYKVTPEGRASVWLEHSDFRGDGINLNGIVFHPSGFLLVIKKSSGALYRVPARDPARFTRVRVGGDLRGGDGLLLAGDKLWVIANKIPGYANNAAHLLQTGDGWASATAEAPQPLGDVYPTTAAALGAKIYVLSSQLDELLGSSTPQREPLIARGRLGELRALSSQ